jgi:tetratricopeptide (TPR) repeat protein
VACASFAAGQADEIAAHAKRAQLAIQANNADAATKELQALIRLDPGNVNAIASLGMVAFTKGDYSVAAAQFEKALARSPSLWSAQAFLGMCEIRLGRTPRGEQLLEQSFPHVTDRTLRVQAGLELVKAYSASGLVQKAEPVLETLAQIAPDNPDVLYSTYRFHSERASAALHRLTQVDKDSALVHQILAQNFMAQEQYPEAIKEYRKALERNPRTLGLHYQLGEALFAEVRAEPNRVKAEAEFLAELALNPADADSMYKLAEIALERGANAKAKEYLLRAIELRPNLAAAHAALGRILGGEQNLHEAIEHLETAAKLAPDVKTTHYRLAQLYRAEGRVSDADREMARFRQLSDVAQ